MACTEFIKDDCMIKFSYLLLGYLWKQFDNYLFQNNDNLGCGYGRLEKMGMSESEHYEFNFWIIPKNKKRRVLVRLYFNSRRVYTKTEIFSKISKRESKIITENAIDDLRQMGLVTITEGV